VRIALLLVSGTMLAGCGGSHGRQAETFTLPIGAAGAVLRYALVDGLPSRLPEETFATIPNVQFLGVDREPRVPRLLRRQR
jgi:hypothetical protein